MEDSLKRLEEMVSQVEEIKKNLEEKFEESKNEIYQKNEEEKNLLLNEHNSKIEKRSIAHQEEISRLISEMERGFI